MSDLTAQEQAHVLGALMFLKGRFRTWASVGGVLGAYQSNGAKLSRIARQGPATVTLAFRLARVIGVGVDDVLAGRYVPKGMCPHCGGTLAPED